MALPEDAILLPEIVDAIFLVVIHPASQGQHEEVQSVGHGLRLHGSDTAVTHVVSGIHSESYRVSRRPHCLGGWGLWDVQVGFSPEVRERAVRMVEEHQEAHASEWAVLQSVAPKLGCTAETLRKWVRQAQRDAGHRPGLTTSERERLQELEREVRELTRANEILRNASAYFAQAELDRRGK